MASRLDCYTLSIHQGVNNHHQLRGENCLSWFLTRMGGTDVVLGHPTIGVLASEEPYFGQVCGRMETVAKDALPWMGKEYQLAVNNGPNAPARRD